VYIEGISFIGSTVLMQDVGKAADIQIGNQDIITARFQVVSIQVALKYGIIYIMVHVVLFFAKDRK
jgi:hypothetical protein